MVAAAVAVASVVSDSVRPHRRQPIRLPRPWDSPGKNTGVGCHFLLHMIWLQSLIAQVTKKLAHLLNETYFIYVYLNLKHIIMFYSLIFRHRVETFFKYISTNCNSTLLFLTYAF